MTIVVMHAPGEARGARPWREAFRDARFDDVIAPDLPGHGDAPPPLGGDYTRIEGARAAAQLVADGLDLSSATLVGVGGSGWSALVMALAGQGARLVLVDGLGTPWLDDEARHARRRASMRSVTLDPASMAPVTHGPDPRLAHRDFHHGDEQLVRDAASRITIPTLLVGAEAAAANAVADAFAAPATVLETTPEPASVVAEIGQWLSGESSRIG